MAGSITVSTINNDTGVFVTQNAMTGIAKAWVNYNGTTQTVRSSFNVSSVVRSGAGNYTINFTVAMPNANYAVTGAGLYASNRRGFPTIQSQSTSAVTVYCHSYIEFQGPLWTPYINSLDDHEMVSIAVLSS